MSGIYFIEGHGGENSPHVFTVPKGYTIVVKNYTGSYGYSTTKPLLKLCSMPTDIIRNPEHHKADIVKNFGSVAIYTAGDVCPDFSYELVSCYLQGNDGKNLPKIYCDHPGSGVIDIKKIDKEIDTKKRNKCKSPGTFSFNDYPSITSDQTFDYIDMVIKHVAGMYRWSVYPTPDMVEFILKQSKELLIPVLHNNNELIKKIYSILTKGTEGLLSIKAKATQSELIEKLKGGGVFYNFVCRVTTQEIRNTLYEYNRNLIKNVPKLNRILKDNYRNDNYRNIQLKHIRETIKHRKPSIMNWYKTYGVPQENSEGWINVTHRKTRKTPWKPKSRKNSHTQKNYKNPRIQKELFQKAIREGNIHLVDKLLKHDKTIDPRDDGNYAFLRAIEMENLAIVDILLQDPRVDPSYSNNTAFQTAVEMENLGIVERLLQDPRVDPSAQNNIAFIEAAENGNLAIVERLLQDPRIDPSAQNNVAIRIASENGHLAIVERLLQDPRVDPSDNSNDALINAVEYHHLDIIDRLLQDPRIDPSAQNNVAIRIASENEDLSIVDRLLQDPRGDPSIDDNKLIKDAFANGNLAIVERLRKDPRVGNVIVTSK